MLLEDSSVCLLGAQWGVYYYMYSKTLLSLPLFLIAFVSCFCSGSCPKYKRSVFGQVIVQAWQQTYCSGVTIQAFRNRARSSELGGNNKYVPTGIPAPPAKLLKMRRGTLTCETLSPCWNAKTVSMISVVTGWSAPISEGDATRVHPSVLAAVQTSVPVYAISVPGRAPGARLRGLVGQIPHPCVSILLLLNCASRFETPALLQAEIALLSV